MVMNTLKDPTQKFEQFWLIHDSENPVARMDFHELLDDVIDIIEDAEDQLDRKDDEYEDLRQDFNKDELEDLQSQIETHEELNGTLQRTVERQNEELKELRRKRDQLEEAETAAAGVLDKVKKSYEAEITKLKRALHADQNAVSTW